MNRAQFVVHSYLLQHWRLIILKSRQQGISTYFLVSFNDDALTRSNLKCGLMAQGKAEAATLLDRVQTLWDTLDPAILSFLDLRVQTKNTTERSYTNNSSIFIRTSFRSATLQRLHISEFGKIANDNPRRARETKTGTLQTLKAGNIGAIESTAEGANDFKTMWDTAVSLQATAQELSGKDFMPVFLPWHTDPDCLETIKQPIDQKALDYFDMLKAKHGINLSLHQKYFWVSQHRELEGDIHQEYPATPEEAFAAAKDGTYWARRYLEYVVRLDRVVEDLYDPALPVHMVADIGVNDLTVLLFFQYFEGLDGVPSVRIIGEYYNSGEFIGFYADYVLHQIVERRGWQVARVGLPHDAAVKDISSEERMSREDILNSRGLTQTTILPKSGLLNGIENVRAFMPFVHLDKKCSYISDCMLKYTKEWNDTANTWNTHPRRAHWNHGADATRYMVQYILLYLISGRSLERVYSTGEARDHGAQSAQVIGGISL